MSVQSDILAITSFFSHFLPLFTSHPFLPLIELFALQELVLTSHIFMALNLLFPLPGKFSFYIFQPTALYLLI